MGRDAVELRLRQRDLAVRGATVDEAAADALAREARTLLRIAAGVEK